MKGDKIGSTKYNSVICTDCGDDDVEDEITKSGNWSDPESWPNQTIPQANEDVTIETDQEIILDMAIEIKELIIRGRLVVNNDRDMTIIKAKNILVEGKGEFIVGSKSELFEKNLEIILQSQQTDNEIVLSNLIPPTNNAIVVAGTLEIHAKTYSILHTKLKESALVNSNTLVVFDNVSEWKEGDQIVLTSTSQNHNEDEKLTIKSINGSNITIEENLAFNHYGSDSITDSFNDLKLDMRAEVINLSRNVVITKEENIDWGCRILVVGYKNYTTNRTYYGLLKMKGVEIRNCGQYLTENAALGFLRTYNTNTHLLENCSIVDSSSAALSMSNSINIEVKNNVFFNSIRHGVFVQLTKNLNFSNNFIVKTKNRENTGL